MNTQISKMTDRELAEESLSLLRALNTSPMLFRKRDISIEIAALYTGSEMSGIILELRVGDERTSWELKSSDESLADVVNQGIRAVAASVAGQIRKTNFKF